MEQANKTEELISRQMTLKEARNVIWPRNNPEFYKPMGALLEEDLRQIASVFFSQRSLAARLVSGVNPPPGFRWSHFQCSGKFSAWSG